MQGAEPPQGSGAQPHGSADATRRTGGREGKPPGSGAQPQGQPIKPAAREGKPLGEGRPCGGRLIGRTRGTGRAGTGYAPARG
ncbi:hypothetical protein GCM10010326_22610 [Streptomyces xanthochromogenes]|uniref:Uncharacterized protein n=1 Tax=Streptomyces xanthochromogenes TaxID=67384 RepID=A0ABQ2ZXC9_9ACTN|nr:hypothetical protein GCM10010326_22610 [Streptomyces xanthochromogenes]